MKKTAVLLFSELVYVIALLIQNIKDRGIITKIPALVLFCSFLISCRQQDPDYPGFMTAPDITSPFITSKWHISSYIRGSVEIADSFKDYSLQFRPDNVLLVIHCNRHFKGKWFVSSEYGTDDAPPADTGFSIDFATGDGLSFKGNYHILKHTSSKLSLQSFNNTNQKLELLEFKRSEN